MNADEPESVEYLEPMAARPRRRLRIVLGIVGLCVLIGLIAVLIVWLARAPRFTANATIRVAPYQQKVLPGPCAEETPFPPKAGDYDIYKETQEKLIKSRFVLNAALREKKVKDLPCVTRHKDPLKWLTKELRVTTFKGTELIEVAITLPDGKDAADIVNAVVAAYKKEIVDVERNVRVARLSELERTYSEMEGLLRQKWGEYRQLSETAGDYDTDALAYLRQFVGQQAAQARADLVRVQFDLEKAKADLGVAETMLQSEQISDLAVDQAAKSDLLCSQVLYPLLVQFKREMLQLEQSAPASKNEKLKRDLDAVERQIETRRVELRKGLVQGLRTEIEREIKRLQANVAALSEQEKRSEAEFKSQFTALAKLKKHSIDLERAKAEYEQLEKIVASIAEERERLKVELRAPSRIQVMGDPPAVIPDSPDE